jgi:predicted RNA binding protein with dsRBD fold (UPF0201 family)
LHGGEKPNELPESISKLVRKVFPDADVTRVQRDDEDGETEYDVRLKNRADGRALFVEVRTDAGVTEIEEEVKGDELPPKVRKALEKAFPRVRITGAQKRSEIRLTYEIDIDGRGGKREVTISPRGRVLEVEERD